MVFFSLGRKSLLLNTFQVFKQLVNKYDNFGQHRGAVHWAGDTISEETLTEQWHLSSGLKNVS